MLLLIFGALLIISAAGRAAINSIFKNKVEYLLANRLPTNINQKHDQISLNTFEGSIPVSNAEITITNKSDDTLHNIVTLEELNIEDISYWN